MHTLSRLCSISHVAGSTRRLAVSLYQRVAAQSRQAPPEVAALGQAMFLSGDLSWCLVPQVSLEAKTVIKSVDLKRRAADDRGIGARGRGVKQADGPRPPFEAPFCRAASPWLQPSAEQPSGLRDVPVRAGHGPSVSVGRSPRCRSAADGITRPCLVDSRLTVWGGVTPLTPERICGGSRMPYRRFACHYFRHAHPLII